MSASIDGSAIDKVLRDAVDSGGVPHVAAIAADRDGVIYAGAAGPRAVPATGRRGRGLESRRWPLLDGCRLPDTAARGSQGDAHMHASF